MFRTRPQILLRTVRFKDGWQNRLDKNVEQNQAHQRKMNLLRKKQIGLPHWGLMNKIAKKEDQGITHDNFQWQGWDPIELNEAYRKEARNRRKVDMEEKDKNKTKKSFIEAQPRSFKEARSRRDDAGAGLEDEFEWEVEHGGLTDEERWPLRGKTEEKIDDYFQNGNWPNHRANWKQAFKNYLKKDGRHSMVHERHIDLVHHEMLKMQQDWYVKKNDIIKVENASNISAAIHLDQLYKKEMEKKGKLSSKRIITHIIFRHWADLKAFKLSELKGIELVRMKYKHHFAEHSSLQAPPKLIAYGKKPSNHHRHILLNLRDGEPLNGVRILIQGDVNEKDFGALVRTASLSGCNSVFKLLDDSHEAPFSIYDPLTIRGSAGLVFTIPVYERATLQRDTTQRGNSQTNTALQDKDFKHKIEPISIAQELNPNYPPRFYLVNGSLEATMQSYDEELVKVLQEQNISTSDTCLPHAYATEIEWTYPNIIIFVSNGFRSKTAIELLASNPGSCVILNPSISHPLLAPANNLNINLALSSTLFEARRYVLEESENIEESEFDPEFKTDSEENFQTETIPINLNHLEGGEEFKVKNINFKVNSFVK